MTDPLSSWIGRREVVKDAVDPRSVAQMDALLGGEGHWPAAGTPLPFGWHWMYFAPRAPQGRLGLDGHPQKGGFMPPVPLPQRMFAETKLRFGTALRVGQEIICTREITKITEKNGLNGPLIFVELSEDVHVAGRLALRELRTILYRGAASQSRAPLPGPVPEAPKSDWCRTIHPDPVALFRFSALTFNGHRIHYDRAYAVEAEHYPGLVVHGPFIALLLVNEGLQFCSEKTPLSFTCRALAPLFDDAPFDLAGKFREEENVMDLWAVREDGVIAMTAILSF